ncbi:MAG: hypothetical protein ACPGNT_05680, partial [Rhodospirillales bacterium]
MTISKADCRALVRHQPTGDVAFKPEGETLGGRAVVPADVNPESRLLLPEVFEFNVTRDLSY